ncbi:unnamed protein product, partial [Discosporangium mesarthrocarpum]
TKSSDWPPPHPEEPAWGQGAWGQGLNALRPADGRILAREWAAAELARLSATTKPLSIKEEVNAMQGRGGSGGATDTYPRQWVRSLLRDVLEIRRRADAGGGEWGGMAAGGLGLGRGGPAMAPPPGTTSSAMPASCLSEAWVSGDRFAW